MDEPTASLGVKQASRLLEMAKELPKRGISVIYISHRMLDIFSLCDRVIVLKTGEKAADVRTDETSIDEIVKIMMIGKQQNNAGGDQDSVNFISSRKNDDSDI